MTIPYTIVEENRHGIRCVVVRWTLESNQVGQPFDGVSYPDKTVQMTGTFGAAVTLQGSNELPTPTNWATLTDPQGNTISMTSSGMEAVMENPYWVRPSAASGVTSVTITLVCSQIRK